jgi:hypothetical protein
MRGAKVDRPVSRLLFKNGFFRSRDSFVSLNGNEPHLFLAGDDVSHMRRLVFQKSHGKCAEKKCRKPIEWETFEMDHIVSGLVGRCDDITNLQALCHPCHVKKHNREPQFTKRVPQSEVEA